MYTVSYALRCSCALQCLVPVVIWCLCSCVCFLSSRFAFIDATLCFFFSSSGGTPAPGGRTPFRGGAASPAAPSEAGSSYSRFPSAAPSEAGYDGNAPNELSPPPGEFIGDIYEGRKLRRRKSFLKCVFACSLFRYSCT